MGIDKPLNEVRQILNRYKALVLENCKDEAVQKEAKELNVIANRIIDDVPNYISYGPFC